MIENVDINTLSRATGVSVRTIRYYLAEGLLPPPRGRGPAASYNREHLDRLRLIRHLQAMHQTLSDIKARLTGLDAQGVVRTLAELEGEGQVAPRSAADYVRQVLADADRGAPPPPPVAPPPPGAEPRMRMAATPERSTWERISLHRDIELHVRRPLGRADQRRLEALLEEAKRLFSGND
jgi:DNA-binding transcriptional MerR regulator